MARLLAQNLLDDQPFWPCCPGNPCSPGNPESPLSPFSPCLPGNPGAPFSPVSPESPFWPEIHCTNKTVIIQIWNSVIYGKKLFQ